MRPSGAPYTREIPKQKGHPTMWDSLITVGTSTPGPPLGHRLTPLARSGSGGESPHTCSNVWQEQNLGWMKAGRAAQWWFLTPDPFPPRPLALCFYRKACSSAPLPNYQVQPLKIDGQYCRPCGPQGRIVVHFRALEQSQAHRRITKNAIPRAMACNMLINLAKLLLS